VVTRTANGRPHGSAPGRRSDADPFERNGRRADRHDAIDRNKGFIEIAVSVSTAPETAPAPLAPARQLAR